MILFLYEKFGIYLVFFLSLFLSSVPRYRSPFDSCLVCSLAPSLADGQRGALDQGVMAHLELDAILGFIVAHGPDLAVPALHVEVRHVHHATLVLVAEDLQRA